MSRYIDADEFVKRVIQYPRQSTKTIGLAIADTPTADVVEKSRYDILLEHANILAEEMRKYQNADVPERNVGKWVEVRQAYDWWSYECSECGFVIMDESTEEYNYCPHCGAKMDGEETDDVGKSDTDDNR